MCFFFVNRRLKRCHCHHFFKIAVQVCVQSFFCFHFFESVCFSIEINCVRIQCKVKYLTKQKQKNEKKNLKKFFFRLQFRIVNDGLLSERLQLTPSLLKKKKHPEPSTNLFLVQKKVYSARDSASEQRGGRKEVDWIQN